MAEPAFSDDELAAFIDDTLAVEKADALRAALASDAGLRARVAVLEDARRMLAAAPPARPDLSARVLAEIDARARARAKRAPLFAAAAAGAGVCALLFVVVRPGDPVARGAPSPDVVVGVRAGADLARVDDGATVQKPVRLAVDVAVLPERTPRALAVWARDASGRVTWLRPSFTDAAHPPACEALPANPAALPAPLVVEVDAPPGTLEVAYVVRPPASCSVPALDRALEKGERVDDAHRVARLRVR